MWWLRRASGFVLGWCLLFGIETAVEGRVVPDRVTFDELATSDLGPRAVPLGEAGKFAIGRLGRLRQGSEDWVFNPERVLVKLKGHARVRVLRVEVGREWDAVLALRQRKDVTFSELDRYQSRASEFIPNDPLRSNQWHHAVIGSFAAWSYSQGEPFVQIAIVDTPFQMDHPDLAAHTDPGWDVVNELPVTASSGIDHSTMCAGMAAAVINNATGVAGAGNCRVLPININGALSEMHDAVVWAADHGVRLVSISWTGAYSDTVNEAGEYLRTKARGVLLMAGVNGTGFLDYPNQPYIYCVSMTDAAENMRSRFGNHIDFSAPGWDVFSTTVAGGYRSDSGTSYATPLVAGIMGVLMSINPTLGGEEVIELLKDTAQDYGAPGWDQFFGWGRVNFGAAAAATSATIPGITSIAFTNGQALVTTELKTGIDYEVWRSSALETPAWQRVTNAATITNGSRVTLLDPTATPGRSFYRIRFIAP